MNDHLIFTKFDSLKTSVRTYVIWVGPNANFDFRSIYDIPIHRNISIFSYLK